MWPPGVGRFGPSPAALGLVRAAGADALWAAEDALRCPAVGGTVLVVPAGMDLTASRRLQLAAEVGGGLGPILIDPPALSSTSASRTRWLIGCSPDTSLVEHSLEAGPWHVELVKALGGRAPERSP